MASDLSSGCTEINEAFDDEKEEGEISLEDVSSSEEGQPYKYPPRAFGQCPYCLSTQQCNRWCRSLTINKSNIIRDAGLQGKENRYLKDTLESALGSDIITVNSAISKIGCSYSTLQEKNDDDATNKDLVPISSDSDMELVGLQRDKKKSPRHRTILKKMRKKRRKKSLSPLSLTPSPLDLTLSINESLHRVESVLPIGSKKEKNVGHSKNRRHSPEKKKSSIVKSLPSRRHSRISRENRLRTSTALAKRRPRSPPRKTSPLRSRKLPITTIVAVTPPQKKQVNHLLKKVRQLEPFSLRSKEKGSSLKDKLSNIIKSDKKEITPENVSQAKHTNKTEVIIGSKDKEVEIIKYKDKHETKEKVAEEKIDEILVEEDDDLVVLRQIALKTKHKKIPILRPDQIKIEHVEEPEPSMPSQSPPSIPQPPSEPAPSPPAPPASPEATSTDPLPAVAEEADQQVNQPAESQKPCAQEKDEDLELRMIALRSAVLKKHRTRMQCGGLKRKKSKSSGSPVPRIESPFTSSFTEDFPLLAEICNPASPLSCKQDIYCTEDMELDSDMELDKGSDAELPYSPTDDFDTAVQTQQSKLLASSEGVGQMVGGVSSSNDTTINSLYSPSAPTVTPAFKALQPQTDIGTKELATTHDLDGSILQFACQEQRPYSPSDDTVYDPDLPGVHADEATGVVPLEPPPLPPMQPPPMPPPLPSLGMFNPQQTMMHSCSLNPFAEPMPMVSQPPAITGFPAVHQSVNPLMLHTAAPLFTYPTPVMQPPPSIPSVPNVTSVTSISSIQSIPSISDMDDLESTDLDGSPLVPMEKDEASAANWPLLVEPLYLQGIPNITESELNRVPTLMESSLLPAPLLKKQLGKKTTEHHLLKSTLTRCAVTQPCFRNADMTPVSPTIESVTPARCLKPIKLQPISTKSITATSDRVFEATCTRHTDKSEPKRQTKSIRSRSSSRTPREIKSKRDSRSSRDSSRKSTSRSERISRLNKEKEPKSTSRSSRSRGKETVRDKETKETKKDPMRSVKDLKSSKETKKETKKSDDKKRRSSVDDDEDALRQILLASLAKRAKDSSVTAGAQKLTVTPTSEVSTPNKTGEQSPSITPHLTVSEEPKNSPETITINPMVKAPTVVSTPPAAPVIPLKRPAAVLAIAEQPVRKLVKKVSIFPASTKVVNNAKRYQNLLHQRKLNQQKVSLLPKNRFKVNNNAVGSRSLSPQVPTKPVPEEQRIIINLNEDTESESEEETCQSKISPSKKRPALVIPTTDFERSVDQFLKNVRFQQEKAAGLARVTSPTLPPKMSVTPPATTTPPTTNSSTSTVSTKIATPIVVAAAQPAKTAAATAAASAAAAAVTVKNLLKDKPAIVPSKLTKVGQKLASLTATPQAIKQLSASQQEEYRRLKQQIFEREKLKLQKSKESTTTSTTCQTALEKSSNTTSSPLSVSPSSPTPSIALASSTPKTATKIGISSTSTIKQISPIIKNDLPDISTSKTIPKMAISSTVIKQVSSLVKKDLVSISSTPKIIPKVFTSTTTVTKPISPLVKTELLSVNKSPAKSQLVATISPMSKQKIDNSTTVPSKISVVIPSSTKKISKITPLGINADSTNLCKTELITNVSSIKKCMTSTHLKTMISPLKIVTNPTVPKINKQQAALLDKMNHVLNNQKKQITAVAKKVSTLRILTKEQINLKTAQIQQSIPMSEIVKIKDLNKNTLKVSSSDKKSDLVRPERQNKEGQVGGNSTVKSDITSNKLTPSGPKSIRNLKPEKSFEDDKPKQSWEEFKRSVSEEVLALANLPNQEQKNLLATTEEQLITKRHSVLDDISEMSGNLRQWEIERDLQNTLTLEIKKLKDQLRLAEEKLQHQKEKLNSIQPKVSNYHEKINTGRKECFRLSKICNGLGQHISGSGYKVPTAGAELLNNRIKEVALHTQKLSGKKTYSKNPVNNNLEKTNITKTKNNNKFNNKNFKRKQLNKHQHNKDDIDKSKLDSIKINLIVENVKVDENNTKESIKIINNTNNCENETQAMEIDVNNSNLIMENVNTKSKNLPEKETWNSTVESENNLNLNTEISLNNDNISNSAWNTEVSNPPIETQSLEFNTTKTINVDNIESEKSLLNSNLVNLIVNTEESSDLVQINNNNSSLIINKSASNVNQLKESDNENIIIQESSTNLENELFNSTKDETEISTTEEINSEKANLLTNYNVNTAVSFKVNIHKEKSDEQLRVTSIDHSDLDQNNVLTTDNKERSIETDENINLVNEENIVQNKDESTSGENASEIISDDVNITNEDTVETNRLSVNENIKHVQPKELLIETNVIDTDLVTSLQQNEVEVQSVDVKPNITSLNSINLKNISSNSVVEKTDNDREKLDKKNHKIIKIESELESNCSNNDRDSTLLEEIALLELATATEVEQKVFKYSKSNKRKKAFKRFSKKIQEERVQEAVPLQYQGDSKKTTVQPYESILKHLQAPRNNMTDGILCPYELMGTCNDGDCQFVHQSTSHCR